MLVKRSSFERIIFTIIFILFTIYAVSLVFPFLWTMYSSFKSNFMFVDDIWGLPKSFYIDNYSFIILEYPIGAMFVNTAVYTAGGVFFSLMLSSMAAYIVSKYRFRMRNFIYILAITAIVVPQLGSLPSLYRLMTATKLIDTWPGIFMMCAGAFGGNFLLLYSFYKNISWSYAESAFIDGANHFKVYTKIMFPLARGGFIAMALIQGIGLWNDYFTPYVFLFSHATLSVGLAEMSSLATSFGYYTQLFAGTTIVTLPVLIIYAFFGKMIMENTIAGGIKG